MATAIRSEHVGSLLRPPELLEARAALDRGDLERDELREIEDRAVLAALELQRDAGMPVFTDGEMRRGSWLALWWETLEGVIPVDEPGFRIEWHDIGDASISQEELQLEAIAVGAELRPKVPLTEIEADFLREHAPGPFKITMPSPNMTATLWRPGISDRIYATPADMLRVVAELQIAEIDALVARGVSWIQLDSLRYLTFLDADLRRNLEGMGLDPEEGLRDAVALDNAVIGAIKRHPGVTTAVHICRGNNRSAWMASGSYAPVAEQLFGELDVDRFLLEYDTERAGGFEPLRFVPPGKTVVLGLISSKTPQLESQDALRRRIEEAARYVAPEDLALSPQCGFASTAQGNLLSWDDQRRKLELVVDTAQHVWG
jgi:5-methyltetrahydropteroyltriglutamate--homocysteine methyltransferase